MYNKEINNIKQIELSFPNEQVCIYHLEKLRWNGNPVSPFDKDSKVYLCSRNKYKCKNTGKYFNVKTKTIFSKTKIPLQKWFIAIWILTEQQSSINIQELAEKLDVTSKTANSIAKRIKKCYNLN